MGNERSIQVADRAEIKVDTSTTRRVVESLVLRGDISELTPEERSGYYVQLCESIGLSPASLPFIPLRLNGKEILYASRNATDQLAAMHRITREIIDGPKVIDLAGTKLVYAVCKATHPNGRSETAVATVALTDPVNVLMKAETKSKRRATLSILGLGMLSQDEVDDIPSQDKQPAQQVNVSVVQTRPVPAGGPDELVESPAADTPALDALNADLDAVDERGTTLLQAARVWRKHSQAVYTESGSDMDAVYEAQQAVLGVMKVAGTRNQLNEHVSALKRRDESPAEGTYAMVLDLLEMTESGDDVTEVWRKHKPAIESCDKEAQTLLRHVATRRVQELVPDMSDAKKAQQWLKNALVPKKPEPPNGGGPKPEAPAEADPERAAIEADANGAAPQATASTGDALPATQLREELAKCVATAHLYNSLFKYGPGVVPQDEAVQIAAERMAALGANILTALKAVREEIDRRGGWKPSKRAA